MIEVTLILTALSFGLASSAHCLMMCGGIAIAGANGSNNLKYSVLYSSGRVLSYALMGAVMGFLGEVATPTEFSMKLIRLLSAVMIVLMGLYILGLRASLNWLEGLGKSLIWRHVQPYLSGLFPLTTARSAILAGAMWGLLPCGMVYAALVWSATSADSLNGALIMFAFGLGTLPSILSISLLPKLAEFIRKNSVKKFIGICLIAFGLFNGYQYASSLIASPEAPRAHQHHHH